MLTFDTPNATSIIEYDGSILGGGFVEKFGSGALQFIGNVSNFHAGTAIRDGRVVVNRAFGQIVLPGATFVGDGSGTQGSTILELIGDKPFAIGSALTVNRDGMVTLAAGSRTQLPI